jgi:hypothetical protein
LLIHLFTPREFPEGLFLSTNAIGTTPKMEEKKDNATKKEEPKKKKREIGC